MARPASSAWRSPRVPGRLAAVVAGEDDERIVGKLEAVESTKQLADRPVQFLDEVSVGTGFLPLNFGFGTMGLSTAFGAK